MKRIAEVAGHFREFPAAFAACGKSAAAGAVRTAVGAGQVGVGAGLALTGLARFSARKAVELGRFRDDASAAFGLMRRGHRNIDKGAADFATGLFWGGAVVVIAAAGAIGLYVESREV